MMKPTLPAMIPAQTVTPRSILLVGVLAAGALLCSLTTAIGVLRSPEPPVVIAVSVKSLLEDHTIRLLGQDISDVEAETRTTEFVHAVESAIADYTTDGSVIVIASEAVIGPNVPDFTEEVRTIAQARAKALAAQRGVNLPDLTAETAASIYLDRMSAKTAELQEDLNRLSNNQGRRDQ